MKNRISVQLLLTILFFGLFHMSAARSEVISSSNKNMLRVQLALTADDTKFRRDWEDFSKTPVLDVSFSTRLNAPVSTVVLFEGCQPDSNGKCNVSVQFSVTDPTGNKKTGSSGQLWSSPPIQGKLMLGAFGVTLKFADPNSIGTYKVHALVTDKVTGRAVEAVISLSVTS